MSGNRRTELAIPEMMKAVRQHGAGKDPVIEQVQVPVPGPGEVLVRMHAAPINPSDLKLLEEGGHGQGYPFIPGLEGSGMVVRSGGGFVARLRSGKRVACSPMHGAGGTWAEYMVTKAVNTAPLPSSVSFEQGSMMLVNPMTARALMDIARKGKHAAVVNNAAASALGRMLIKLGQKQGIPVISIVRNRDQAAMLEDMGAGVVLNSSERNFETTLEQTAREAGATLILDAVTGPQTALLLRAAPRNATLIAYARLSGEPIIADPADLIREGKQITGFQLGNWLQTKSTLSKLLLIRSVKKELAGPLSSQIKLRLPMERVTEAMDAYRQQMSGGKVILLMNEPETSSP